MDYLWICKCDIYFKIKTMWLDWASAQPSAVRAAGFLPNIWSPNHSRGAQSNLRNFHLKCGETLMINLPICKLRKDGDGMRGGGGRWGRSVRIWIECSWPVSKYREISQNRDGHRIFLYTDLFLEIVQSNSGVFKSIATGKMSDAQYA